MQHQPVRVAVIIVTYNSARVLPGCLASLRRQGPHVALTTVVVDNGSRDATRALVRTQFPEVQLVEATRNGGFSYGNNLGLHALGLLGAPPARGSAPPVSPPILGGRRGTEPGSGHPPSLGGAGGANPGAGGVDYVLYLNPDTELPPDAVEALVRLMEARPEIGALSPRLVRADGSLDMACRRALPTPWNSFCHVVGLDRLWPRSPRFAEYNLTYLPEDRPTAVGCVAAAFMLVRAAAVARVGPWDERFFAYGEDIDYCLRVRRAGWLIWYEPSVRVLHLKGAASQQRSLPMLREFYRAMDVYYRKHLAACHPLPLRLVITAAVRALYTAALLRQLTRPAGKRWVGSARPTKL